MRFAVIGTGAAALGVMQTLVKQGAAEHDITIFDIGVELPSTPLMKKHPREFTVEDHTALYDQILKGKKRSVIPSVTHFGYSPSKYVVNEKPLVWKGDQFGGLLNYWSSSMFPLMASDFEHWPVNLQAMRPYYQEIANLVGVAGSRDRLNELFEDDFSNRPPVDVAPVLNKLTATINGNSSRAGTHYIIAGMNRLGVETRPGHERSCVYCGECFNGCFRDSIFASRGPISEYLKLPNVRFVKGKVRFVKSTSQSIQVTNEHSNYEGFDKVFLCAGCPGTSEIALRSFDPLGSLTMADNDSYIFPIFYLGLPFRGQKKTDEQYLAIANTIIACAPQDRSGHFSQAHVSLAPDNLLRYHLPSFLWLLIKPLGRLLRRRVFFGKLYLHSAVSRSYKLTLDGRSDLHFEKIENPKGKSSLKDIMKQLKKAVNGGGYYIPPIPPIPSKTSSHYASTLAYGNKVNDRSEIAPQVYACDSSVFPHSPAQPLTFTIMANAARIAHEALKGEQAAR